MFDKQNSWAISDEFNRAVASFCWLDNTVIGYFLSSDLKCSKRFTFTKFRMWRTYDCNGVESWQVGCSVSFRQLGKGKEKTSKANNILEHFSSRLILWNISQKIYVEQLQNLLFCSSMLAIAKDEFWIFFHSKWSKLSSWEPGGNGGSKLPN